MREAAAAPIAAALAAALALAALPSAAQPVPGTRFERFATRDAAGREIAFVLAPAAAPGAALALFVQGSGCAPLFRARQDGNFAGGYQATLAAVAAGRVATLAVEKPGAEADAARVAGGTAEACPAEFLAEHTVARWGEALAAALAAARARTRAPRVLVVGHSEGAQMAAWLAAAQPEIDAVALLSGPLRPALADLKALRPGREAELDALAAAIARDPDSTARFALGHPYRRWSSFLALDPVALLAASRARVLVVHGDRDASVPVAGVREGAAALAASGRELRLVVEPGADHSLDRPGEAPPAGMACALAAALAWFLGG